MATNADFEQAIDDNDVRVVRDFLRNGEGLEDFACFSAVRQNSNAVLRLLIKAGANLKAVGHPKSGGGTLLMTAIDAKNMTAFRMLLKAGASINQRGSSEYPLHVAAQDGSVEFTKACIAAGAKLDSRDRYGNTSLMTAARFGRIEVVKLLLKAGANPRVLDLVRRTAYDVAIDSNEPEVAKILQPVSQRPPPKLRGVPALLEAVSKQDMVAVEKCLSRGVDINGRDRFGRSPMDKAIGLGSATLVQRLIEAGVDLNKVDPEGTSFLEGALRAEKWEIARQLLNAGALPNPPGNRQRDAIHTAIYANDPKLLKLLVSKGANPRSEGLLSIAVAAKRMEAVRFLLSQGADPNEQDSEGWTPLFHAVFNPLLCLSRSEQRLRRKIGGLTVAMAPEASLVRELVELLIKHGADLKHVDKEGRTALDINREKSIAKLLK